MNEWVECNKCNLLLSKVWCSRKSKSSRSRSSNCGSVVVVVVMVIVVIVVINRGGSSAAGNNEMHYWLHSLHSLPGSVGGGGCDLRQKGL